MKTLFLTLLLIFAGSLPANFVFAANPLNVVISEIAWMGTETSAMNEWIELYNNTTSTIDITGWTLKSSDTSPNITFSTIIEQKIYRPRGSVNFSIPREGFYLMERTDDDTVMDIPANYIYTGALNNSGEKLELRDAQGNLIDAVDCADGWLFGDNATKQTMERKNLLLSASSNNWQTSALPGGTPNSLPQEIAADDAKETPLSLRGASEASDAAIPLSNSPQPDAAISFPANIIINEILPSPDGPDSENEWIEIFNQNNFSVNISDWKIADTKGSVKSYTFPQNTIIKAKSFLLLVRPQTKITLNNNEDGLNLIHPDGTITDSVIFTKAKLNQSYNRSNDNWVWSNTLTPGWENIIPVAPVAKNITKENSVPDADNHSNSEDSHSGPTPVSGTYRGRTAVNTAVNFTASLLALFSAFSILALKKSINKP